MSIQNQALGKVSWDVKDCRQDCRRLAEDTWGVLGKASERGGKGVSTPKQKDFLSACCFPSFLAKTFEQELTDGRNVLLAPLHFYLLF
jgi:hypothetical protein